MKLDIRNNVKEVAQLYIYCIEKGGDEIYYATNIETKVTGHICSYYEVIDFNRSIKVDEKLEELISNIKYNRDTLNGIYFYFLGEPVEEVCKRYNGSSSKELNNVLDSYNLCKRLYD